MSSTTAQTTFSDEELSRLLALISESDSVELKLTLPESAGKTTPPAC